MELRSERPAWAGEGGGIEHKTDVHREEHEVQRVRGGVRVRRFVSLAFILLLSFPAPAQVYKWVDENGVTHYGERPPQGQKASPVAATPSAGPSPSQAKPQGAQDWQDQNIDFQRRRIQRKQQAEREQQDAATRQRRCNLAKDDLQQMESVERLYDLNEKGERVYLGDAERKAEIERARQYIARNCP
jgi:hypothetical protein